MSKLQPAWKAQHIQDTQTHGLRASHFLPRVCEWVLVTSVPALVSLKLMSEKWRSCQQAVTMLHSPTRWHSASIKPLSYTQTSTYHHPGPHILREIKTIFDGQILLKEEEKPSYSWDSLACLLPWFCCQALNVPRFLHQDISVSLLWVSYESINLTESGKPRRTTAATPPSRARE